jgi:hypothetical protein
MNLQMIDWDQDLPPEDYEEYQTLINALRRKHKNEFGLFFVECTTVEAEKLCSRVGEDITDKKLEILRLSEPVSNLYDSVVELHNKNQFDILFIKGLEYSIYNYEQEKFGQITGKYYYDITGVPQILDHLNQLRESFRDNLPVSLIFLGRPFLIDYFIHRCQDFFDWRSLNVIKLTAIPDPTPQESVISSDCKSSVSV